MAPSLDDEIQLIELLDLLSADSWVSTRELLNTLGTSAPKLSDAVQRLCDCGLVVDRLNGEAYRLKPLAQRLQASRILDQLPLQWRDKMGVTVVSVVDSTSTRLLSDWPDKIPWAILAECQTNGRGRRGRQWHSPFGVNLYLSIAWVFNQPSIKLSTLPLAMGVCCARALTPLGLEEVAIKWPNDLWIHGSKLGGILVECYRDGGVLRVVIGLGINVNMDQGQLQSQEVSWTTLRQVLTLQNKVVPDRNVLAATLLANIADGLRLFSVYGFQPFLDEWVLLDLTRDQAVRISGLEEVIGIARGIDDQGALRVETSRGMILVQSGDVSVRVTSK